MPSEQNIKEELQLHLHHVIDRRILTYRTAARSAQASKNNETKSSAGDKYETGRAMMQVEQEKNELQWQQANQLKQTLNQIDIKPNYDKVSPGSLVTTNQGIYFIAIGIGKIKINDDIYFCISMESPIGKLLQGKLKGQRVEFMGREIDILDVA